jgi:hypothetical protein
MMNKDQAVLKIQRKMMEICDKCEEDCTKCPIKELTDQMVDEILED